MTDTDLHRLFSEWSAWVRSKRLFAPSPNPQSIIGSLVRLPDRRERDADLDANMAALHMATTGIADEPRAILIGYYLQGRTAVKYRRGLIPVKRLADMLGCSRKTFYKRLSAARRTAYEACERGVTI